MNINQQRWVYVGEGGKRVRVTLLHYLPEGHILAYVGKTIVHAEKNVLQSGEFNFFLDKELCKIKINRIGNAFDYQFSVDTDTETPLNVERKQLDKQNQRKGIIAIASILSVTIALIVGGILIHQFFLKKEREENGAMAVGSVYIMPKENSYALLYNFEASGRIFSRELEYYRDPHPKAPNGFPLYTNDEFFVQYATASPNNNEILFDRPTPKQFQRYQKRAIDIHQKQHPKLSVEYCTCLINAAYELEKLDGIGFFYYQHLPPSKNKRYNIKTYKEFIISKKFRNATDKCNEIEMLK